MTLLQRVPIFLYSLLAVALYWYLQGQHFNIAGLFGQSFFKDYMDVFFKHPGYGFVISRLPAFLVVGILWSVLLMTRREPESNNTRKGFLPLALAVVVIQIGDPLIFPAESFTVNFLNGPPAEALVKFVFTVTLVPIIEEIVFRGFVPEAARKIVGDRFGLWTGIVLSAALFGHLHKQYSLVTQIEIALLGLIFGISRVRSGGLIQPILLHVLASVLAIAGGYIVLIGYR